MQELEFKIDQYILKKLSASETKEIKHRIEHDESVAKLFAERKKIVIYGKLLGHKLRKEELKNMVLSENRKGQKNNPAPLEEPKKLPSNMRLLAIAASFLVLIGCAWWVSTIQTGNTNLNPIVESYYSPYEKSATRAANSDNLSKKEQTEKAYRNREFKKVIELLESPLTNQPEHQLMTGIAYFEESNYQKALSLFNEVAKNNSLDNLYVNSGKWYASLTYIQLKQDDSAIILLKELSLDTEFMNQAKELLSKLGK